MDKLKREMNRATDLLLETVPGVRFFLVTQGPDDTDLVTCSNIDRRDAVELLRELTGNMDAQNIKEAN